MLKCKFGFTAHRLEQLWFGTKLVQSPLFFYAALFLVSTWPHRKGSVFGCSTDGSSAASGLKMSEYGTVPQLTRNGTA